MRRVALDIAAKLGQPVTAIGLRLAGVEAIVFGMKMPEAAVHEDDLPPRPEHEVGLVLKDMATLSSQYCNKDEAVARSQEFPCLLHV